MTPFPKKVCYHEAGHAVAAVAIGREFTRVVVREDASGIVEGTGQVIELRGQYGVWDDLVYSLAGMKAEARATKRGEAAVMFDGGRADMAQAGQGIKWLVERGFAPDSAAAWRRAERDTKDFVHDEWPAIERVAEALRTHGGLEASEVLRLVRGAA